MIWKTADKLSRTVGAKSFAAEWCESYLLSTPKLRSIQFWPVRTRSLASLSGPDPATNGEGEIQYIFNYFGRWFIILRRAVVCYLALNEYAKAEEQLWLCDPADADTLYLQFALSLATGKCDFTVGFSR